MLKKLITVFIFTALLSACHHNMQTAQNLQGGKSGVYVYRINSRLGADQKDAVYVDNHKMGYVKNGAYVKLALKPGKHRLKIYDRHGMSVKTVEHVIDVKPGKNKYVKVQWTPNGKKMRTGKKGHQTWLPKYGPKFVTMSSEQGRREVRTLRHIS